MPAEREAVHTVQRAIHIGRIPVELTRRQESLAAVSSALTLLSNILVAWNTTHMQRALENIEASRGYPSPLRRRLLLAGAALAAGPLAARAVPPLPSTGGDLGGTTLRVATYKGIWRPLLQAAGLADTPYRIDWRELNNGVLHIEALNADALDIGSGSEIPAVFAARRKASVKFISRTREDLNNQVTLARNDTPIRGIADLKGKRVGYVRATTSHYFLYRQLAEAGLGSDDIRAINLSPTDGLSAYDRGDIDAWAIYGYNRPARAQPLRRTRAEDRQGLSVRQLPDLCESARAGRSAPARGNRRPAAEATPCVCVGEHAFPGLCACTESGDARARRRSGRDVRPAQRRFCAAARHARRRGAAPAGRRRVRADRLAGRSRRSRTVLGYLVQFARRVGMTHVRRRPRRGSGVQVTSAASRCGASRPAARGRPR